MIIIYDYLFQSPAGSALKEYNENQAFKFHSIFIFSIKRAIYKSKWGNYKRYKKKFENVTKKIQNLRNLSCN